MNALCKSRLYCKIYVIFKTMWTPKYLEQNCEIALQKKCNQRSFRRFLQIKDILCSSGVMRFSFVAVEKNHTVWIAFKDAHDAFDEQLEGFLLVRYSKSKLRGIWNDATFIFLAYMTLMGRVQSTNLEKRFSWLKQGWEG